MSTNLPSQGCHKVKLLNFTELTNLNEDTVDVFTVYLVKLLQNLASSFQVVCNFFIQKYENRS